MGKSSDNLSWIPTRPSRRSSRRNPVLHVSSRSQASPAPPLLRRLLLPAASLFKSVVREAFAFLLRVLDTLAALCLEFIHQPGYYASRKQRITSARAAVSSVSYAPAAADRLVKVSVKSPPAADSGLFRAPAARASGLLEDLQLLLLNASDNIVSGEQWRVDTSLSAIRAAFFGGLDDRKFAEFVAAAGYPYLLHKCPTHDGKAVLLVDRIPRKSVPKVVLFVHGVLDTAYAWIGSSAGGAASNCAFAAFHCGWDIFLGNFRGTREQYVKSNHPQTSKGGSPFWNFTLNELSLDDMDSMIKLIYAEKKKEGFSDHEVEVVIVAHSLGGAASLVHCIQSKISGKSHGVSKLLLMSPAGVHHKIPWLCKLLGPLISFTIARWDFPVKLPAVAIIRIASKIAQDLRTTPSAKDLMSWVICKLLVGGAQDLSDSAFSKVGNFSYNVLMSATSTGVFRHFWQIYKRGKFELYDYGSPVKNYKVYGQTSPPNMLENFHLLDVPVHFLCGSEDTLIPQDDVFEQYSALKLSHPELSIFHVFEGVSHLNFTYGQNDDLIQYLVKELKS